MSMLKKPLQSILVKPVGPKCNLDCDYCFYLDKNELYPNASVMNYETLDNLIKQTIEQTGREFNITWQGGEPTLAGLDFFKKVIELQIYHGKGKTKAIGNGLQTNGLLIENKWCDFLKEYNFMVGLSLDGPEFIHDNHRVFPNGKGSWKNVAEKGNQLRQAGVETNILCSVTKKASRYPDEIYNYFKENRWQWLQFTPICETDKNGNITEFSVLPYDLGNFYCRIFDLWFEDFTIKGNAPSIRFIENTFHTHMGMAAAECTNQKNCGNYVVVEYNGDVYSCDFFVGQNQYLGNINKSRLTDMLNNQSQNIFGSNKENLPDKCLQCLWIKFCYGGCPKYRNINAKENYFCQAYQIYYKHSNSRFKQLANRWKKNNPQAKMTFDASGYF